MRRLHTRRHRAAAATAAAILVLTACGDDDDPAADVVDTIESTETDETVASADPSPPPDTSDTTSPDTTTPDRTAPTVAAPSTTDRGPSAEEWAAEVVAVYADLESTRADISGRFVELAFAAPGGEVDAYHLATSEMAAALNTAIQELPDEPDDPALAEPFGALRAAMTAEEDGSVELSELIEENRQAFVDEVVANVDPGPDGSPPGTFDFDIRRAHSALWDDTIAACFELQSALVDADLPLLDCVIE